MSDSQSPEDMSCTVTLHVLARSCRGDKGGRATSEGRCMQCIRRCHDKMNGDAPTVPTHALVVSSITATATHPSEAASMLPDHPP